MRIMRLFRPAIIALRYSLTRLNIRFWHKADIHTNSYFDVFSLTTQLSPQKHLKITPKVAKNNRNNSNNHET